MEGPYDGIKEVYNVLMLFVWLVASHVKSRSAGCVFGELLRSSLRDVHCGSAPTHLVTPEIDIRRTLVDPIFLHYDKS